MAKAVNDRVELDLVNWGRTLARRWWLIVAVTLLAAGLALGSRRCRPSATRPRRSSCSARNPSERIVQGNPGGDSSEPARNAATNLALASNEAVVRAVKARLHSASRSSTSSRTSS